MSDNQGGSGTTATPASRSTTGPWALAFSGGGIRSATFCLGLARALAKNRLFARFRILSTVSGGGYVGSAIGRLHSEQANADKVEQGLADDNSLFLWWLRRNGRFLLPAGADDALQVATSYLRSLLATHWEVGVLAGLLAALSVLPHLLMGLSPTLHRLGTLVGTPWWSLLLVMLLPGAAVYFAFWFTREAATRSNHFADAVIALLTAAVVAGAIYFASRPGLHAPTPPWVTTGVLMVLAGVPLGLVFSRLPFAGTARHAHVRFTRWLSYLLFWAGVLGVLGLLDLLSWIAAREFDTAEGGYLFGGLGLTVTLLVGLRAAMPALQKLAPGGSHPVFSVETLAHVLGLLLSFALLFFWMTAVQWWVYFGPALEILPIADPNARRWVAVVAVLCLYAGLSGRNLEQLNRASLYPFYSSRLARAYVSVGNVAASGRFKQAATDPVQQGAGNAVEKISDFIEGDDVAMSRYQPDAHGGPLHIVNVCINQTRDDDTGAYNADRKGTNLAVSHEGFEFGTGLPAHADWLGETTLAQWVAISGAAVASGMGSGTRSGVAALSFLTGLRLGYWWDRGSKPRWPAKYRATLDEWRGRFPGLGHPPLYLSDGGHYDNTGVYALLKRKPALIVAADCGADPSYAFADVENLIRKARIDYRVAIEFVDPRKIDNQSLPHPLPLERFGTPDSIAPEPGPEHLLLARIVYDDGTIGALLVVKPRRVNTLSIDVAGYSDRDPAFPQQTTGDQFFDESQWESYCELGLRLGSVLDARLLEAALAAVLRPDAPLAEAKSLQSEVSEPASNGSRRERISLTTGQKVGIGAALSALVAGWQVLQDAQKRAEEAHRQKQIAIQTLLERDKNDGSLIDKALRVDASAGDTRWKSFQHVVDQLDDFGAAQGSATQDSAIRNAAEAIANRCEASARATSRGAGSEASISPDQCIPVLAALTQARRSAWARSLADYQSQVRNGDAQDSPACVRGTKSFPVLTLRTYDPAQREPVEQLAAEARKRGLRVEHRYEPLLDAYDGLVRQSRTVAWQQQRQAWILSHPNDANCAAYLANELLVQAQKGAKLPDIKAEAVPSLAYGQGEMQVVLWPPQEVQEPAPAPAPPPELAPTPEPASVSAADAGDFGQRRLVYIQFRGNFTRERVNALREALKTPSAKDHSPRNAEVPGAERVAGTYGNSVRYFNDDAKKDAEWLAQWVNWYFEESNKASGCSLEKKAEPLRAHAKGDPQHLEVWIVPDCREL